MRQARWWIGVAVFLSNAACGREAAEPAPEPAPDTRAAEPPAKIQPVGEPVPIPRPQPGTPAPSADGGSGAAAPGADGGAAAAAALVEQDLGTFEGTGEVLGLEGLGEPADAPRYQPLGLPFPAVASLLAATPGLRVRENVGFYPPRPIDLAGRPPELLAGGRVFPLSRPGHWRPSDELRLVLVPYHHVTPSLAIYAFAEPDKVRLVTRLDRGECPSPPTVGFVVSQHAEVARALWQCGDRTDVVQYEARDGKLGARLWTNAPADATP